MIQDSLASPAGFSSNNTGKFPGFGPSSFPGRFRSKDFEIHYSSIGKSASLLGSTSEDGLRFTQALWSKSENLLRSTSHALGTTEHFLSAAGSLLQERGDDFSELKSFLLQVDQAIGISQLLLMGTLGNFTLSKRSEILEKSSVNESLKDSLLSSPLSDKIFGLSVQEVQEEIKKLQQPVKVNVQVANGKRSVVTNPPSGSTHTFPKKRKVHPPTTSSASKPNFSHKIQWAKKTGNRI